MIGNKIILLLILMHSACTDSNKFSVKAANDTSSVVGENMFEFISSLKLPDTLAWCGERIPLEISDVRERAEREFYLLLQQPGQIILYLKRSARYFPIYEKILSENELPNDIKYLSVAESALYMSFSDKGAAGLWQFIPSTGRLMGLQVDDYVDERLHPEKSTRAASKYLKQGYSLFGSWMMTAAGYNMGHTNLNLRSEAQKKKDYFDLFLNDETSRFIFRIALIKEIMSNAEKYGFRLAPIELYQPDKTKIIKWNAAINDITEWASSQGTSYKFVKILNPWIIKTSLPKPINTTGYEILLPE